MRMKKIVLQVNGNRYEVEAAITSTLAEILRDKLGLTGTKVMCNEGECGSCTVLMDGRPVLSCMTLALDCEKREILTIEGVADPATGDLHPIQKAFVAKSGMQCGVCTPGMILVAKALLDENPDPSEAQIRTALSGNLCRCGNYQRIVECVLDAAKNIQMEGRNA
jgi:aerobic carbon-monoxide dehydrogenase small subunit